MAQLPSARCEPLMSEVVVPLPAGALGRLGTPVNGEQQARVNAIVVAPDGKLLAVLCVGKVRRWDVKAGKELTLAWPASPDAQVPDWHPVVSIAFSPDGKTLAVANRWSSIIRLW